MSARRRLAALGAIALLTLVLVAACGGPRQAETPAPAPESEGPEIRPANAAQLQAAVRARGARVTLLNVWATWCIPCREEFPDLLRLRREYREHGLRLILVSADIDSQLPEARAFLTGQGVDFLTYLKQGADMPFIDSLDARWSGALPATLLYDATGQQIWFHEGKTSYDSLKIRIDHVLFAPSEPAP